MNAENVTHFDSFAVERIPKEIRKFNGNKNIVTLKYDCKIKIFIKRKHSIQ